PPSSFLLRPVLHQQRRSLPRGRWRAPVTRSIEMLLPSSLIDTATRQTGLEDFGASSWREGFDRLLAAFNNDAALNELGEQHIARMLVDKLANRLRIEDWH